MLWIKGVLCQRLFRSRAASSWFEVKSMASIGFSIIQNNNMTISKEDNNDDNNSQAAILAVLDE